MKNSLVVSPEVKHKVIVRSINSTPGNYSQKNWKLRIENWDWDTCIPVGIAMLVTIAQRWKQLECLSMDDQINKMLYTIEY